MRIGKGKAENIFTYKRKTRVFERRRRNLEEAKRRGRGRIHFL